MPNCAHMCVNAKMRPSEIISGMGRGNKREWWRG
jgi:hypothetical protein